MPEIQKDYYPTADSSPVLRSHSSGFPEHSVRMTISVDYHLSQGNCPLSCISVLIRSPVPKSEEEKSKKYYFTYSIGDDIDGKVNIIFVTFLTRSDRVKILSSESKNG